MGVAYYVIGWLFLCEALLILPGCLSAVFIPVGPHLSRQGNDAVVLSPVLHTAGQSGFAVRIFDQQAHAAAELTLNGPGCRSNAVFHIVLQQQISEPQSLLIVDKQDVPAKVIIKH